MLLAGIGACAPAGTLRQTPPPDLAAHAAAVGASAPALELATSSGARWSLAEARTRHEPALLVFYRGHW
jgi:hypothetical protein